VFTDGINHQLANGKSDVDSPIRGVNIVAMFLDTIPRPKPFIMVVKRDLVPDWNDLPED
jgi:hypothetical protein